MVISIGKYVSLRTEKIVSVIGYGNTGVEIVMNPISICFDFNDAEGQGQFLELMKVVMTAEGEQAKIIAEGFKDFPYKEYVTYSNRNIDSRLRDISTDIATSK